MRPARASAAATRTASQRPARAPPNACSQYSFAVHACRDASKHPAAGTHACARMPRAGRPNKRYTQRTSRRAAAPPPQPQPSGLGRGQKPRTVSSDAASWGAQRPKAKRPSAAQAHLVACAGATRLAAHAHTLAECRALLQSQGVWFQYQMLLLLLAHTTHAQQEGGCGAKQTKGRASASQHWQPPSSANSCSRLQAHRLQARAL